MTSDPGDRSGRDSLAPAPPPSDDDEAAKIEAAKVKRVDEISALARTAWFSLLAALAFSAVTLFSIDHVDVLLDSKRIELPLVSVPVPTRLFLTLGALALSVLFLNLHLYLIKLWRAFRYAPEDRIFGKDDPRNWRLADQIQPWTVNDYALSLKDGADPRDRPRRHWRNAVTVATVWLATPAVLGWMWWVSLLRREAVVTLPIIACLGFVLIFGSHSWLVANRQLAKEKFGPGPVFNLNTVVAGLVIALIGAATLTAFDPGPTTAAREPIRQVNFDRRDVAGVESALPAAAIQREEYRQKWCEIVDVPLDLCGKHMGLPEPAMIGLTSARQEHCRKEGFSAGMRKFRRCRIYFRQLDARFQSDWMDVRRATLTKVARVDLREMDLAGLSAKDADLTRAMLESADLSWSNLPGATLEDAALKFANLEGVEAYEANLAYADLTATRMPDANLQRASLEGAVLYRADLRRADLRDADLTAADLRAADLTGADLQGARLARADLTGAILSDAKLTGVTGLTTGQLAEAVGGAVAVSRAISDDGDHSLQIVRFDPCWVALPKRVKELVAKFPALQPRYDAFMCPEDVAPETGAQTSGAQRSPGKGSSAPRLDAALSPGTAGPADSLVSASSDP